MGKCFYCGHRRGWRCCKGKTWNLKKTIGDAGGLKDYGCGDWIPRLQKTDLTDYQYKILNLLSTGNKSEEELVRLMYPGKQMGPSFRKAHVMRGLMALHDRGLAVTATYSHIDNPTTGGRSDDTWSITKKARREMKI